MKTDIYTKLLVLMFFIGVALLLYPTLGDMYSTYTQSKAISGYVEAVAALSDDEYEKMIEDAKAFNAEVIYPKGHYSVLTPEEKERYLSLLNLTGSGMMGYVDIPTIDTSLAVYHTTQEKFLQIGAGHLEATSLPVGGENTHCSISGHRGLVSAKLFTNLNQLVEGDIFTLHILEETLTYRVDQIKIVLPESTSDVDIIDGGDYCTPITCTPYGVNTHRLLVRGHRVENIEDTARRIPSDAMLIQPVILLSMLAVPIIACVILWTVKG